MNWPIVFLLFTFNFIVSFSETQCNSSVNIEMFDKITMHVFK